MQKVGKWDWREWAFLGWCVLLVLAALVTIWPGWSEAWPWLRKSSSDIASWVQAFGSIAAIATGFRVARFQLDEQHRHQLEKEREGVRVLERKQCILIFDVYIHVTSWCDVVAKSIDDKTKAWPLFAAGCQDVVHHLDKLTANDYPNPLDAVNVTHIRVQLGNLLFLLQDAVTTEHRAKYDKSLPEYIRDLSAKAAAQKDLLISRVLNRSTASETEEFSDALDAVDPGWREKHVQSCS